jgi:hypothetical protein
MLDIDALIGGKIGTFDVACPLCGPMRRSPVNQRRQTLRVYRHDLAFAGFHCARCGESGYCRDDGASPVNPAKIETMPGEAAVRERATRAEAQKRLGTARWLWSSANPITGTVAENYLRDCRGYLGPLPPTLRFMPASGKHGPAMIAAFGPPIEPEPGQLAIADAAVVGVHITRLKPDGSGKAGTEADKIMIGKSVGFPIVLAPPNDLLGLAISEGIEDALSAHEATGLGAWAAGTAGRLPAMADVVPDYIEGVTVLVDADPNGEKNSTKLAERLTSRGIEVRMARPGVIG